MTMTESLVAIFVVAIGLTGVMALFPFAASQMSHALVSDRTTSLATSIDGFVRTQWPNAGPGDPYWDALDDPGTHDATNLAMPTVPTTSTTTESSYPVFLDPMGVYRIDTRSQRWVGDTGNTYVPRRTMNLVTNQSNPPNTAYRLFSQADGFTYSEDGVPEASVAMRELRYNALAVIQRPKNGNRNSATLTIVTFDKRRHLFYPTDSEQVFTGVTFTPTRTQLLVPTSADIKKGSWIMDGTVTTTPPYIRHANFYRCVSVTDNGSVVGGVPMI